MSKAECGGSDCEVVGCIQGKRKTLFGKVFKKLCVSMPGGVILDENDLNFYKKIIDCRGLILNSN